MNPDCALALPAMVSHAIGLHERPLDWSEIKLVSPTVHHTRIWTHGAACRYQVSIIVRRHLGRLFVEAQVDLATLLVAPIERARAHGMILMIDELLIHCRRTTRIRCVVRHAIVAANQARIHYAHAPIPYTDRVVGEVYVRLLYQLLQVPYFFSLIFVCFPLLD